MVILEEIEDLFTEEKELIDEIKISLSVFKKDTYKLIGKEKNNYLLDIFIGKKIANITFKTSHNHRLNKAIPLIRVDFGSRHKNPPSINEHISSYLAQYKGMEFPREKPHIHIATGTFPNIDLRWAIPLEEFKFMEKGFTVKSVNNDKDLYLLTYELADIITIVNKDEKIKIDKRLF